MSIFSDLSDDTFESGRRSAFEEAAKYIESVAEGQRASFAMFNRSAEPMVSILMSAATGIRGLITSSPTS